MVEVELTFTRLTMSMAVRCRRVARTLGGSFERDGVYALLRLPQKGWRAAYARFSTEAGSRPHITGVTGE